MTISHLRVVVAARESSVYAHLLFHLLLLLPLTWAQSTCTLSSSPLSLGECSGAGGQTLVVSSVATSSQAIYCSSPFTVDPSLTPNGVDVGNFQVAYHGENVGANALMALYQWNDGGATSTSATLLLSMDVNSPLSMGGGSPNSIASSSSFSAVFHEPFTSQSLLPASTTTTYSVCMVVSSAISIYTFNDSELSGGQQATAMTLNSSLGSAYTQGFPGTYVPTNTSGVANRQMWLNACAVNTTGCTPLYTYPTAAGPLSLGALTRPGYHVEQVRASTVSTTIYCSSPFAISPLLASSGVYPTSFQISYYGDIYNGGQALVALYRWHSPLAADMSVGAQLLLYTEASSALGIGGQGNVVTVQSGYVQFVEPFNSQSALPTDPSTSYSVCLATSGLVTMFTFNDSELSGGQQATAMTLNSSLGSAYTQGFPGTYVPTNTSGVANRQMWLNACAVNTTGCTPLYTYPTAAGPLSLGALTRPGYHVEQVRASTVSTTIYCSSPFAISPLLASSGVYPTSFQISYYGDIYNGGQALVALYRWHSPLAADMSVGAQLLLYTEASSALGIGGQGNVVTVQSGYVQFVEPFNSQSALPTDPSTSYSVCLATSGLVTMFTFNDSELSGGQQATAMTLNSSLGSAYTQGFPGTYVPTNTSGVANRQMWLNACAVNTTGCTPLYTYPTAAGPLSLGALTRPGYHVEQVRASTVSTTIYCSSPFAISPLLASSGVYPTSFQISYYGDIYNGGQALVALYRWHSPLAADMSVGAQLLLYTEASSALGIGGQGNVVTVQSGYVQFVEPFNSQSALPTDPSTSYSVCLATSGLVTMFTFNDSELSGGQQATAMTLNSSLGSAYTQGFPGTYVPTNTSGVANRQMWLNACAVNTTGCTPLYTYPTAAGPLSLGALTRPGYHVEQVRASTVSTTIYCSSPFAISPLLASSGVYPTSFQISYYGDIYNGGQALVALYRWHSPLAADMSVGAQLLLYTEASSALGIGGQGNVVTVQSGYVQFVEPFNSQSALPTDPSTSYSVCLATSGLVTMFTFNDSELSGGQQATAMTLNSSLGSAYTQGFPGTYVPTNTSGVANRQMWLNACAVNTTGCTPLYTYPTAAGPLSLGALTRPGYHVEQVRASTVSTTIYCSSPFAISPLLASSGVYPTSFQISYYGDIYNGGQALVALYRWHSPLAADMSVGAQLLLYTEASSALGIGGQGNVVTVQSGYVQFVEPFNSQSALPTDPSTSYSVCLATSGLVTMFTFNDSELSGGQQATAMTLNSSLGSAYTQGFPGTYVPTNTSGVANRQMWLNAVPLTSYQMCGYSQWAGVSVSVAAVLFVDSSATSRSGRSCYVAYIGQGTRVVVNASINQQVASITGAFPVNGFLSNDNCVYLDGSPAQDSSGLSMSLNVEPIVTGQPVTQLATPSLLYWYDSASGHYRQQSATGHPDSVPFYSFMQLTPVNQTAQATCPALFSNNFTVCLQIVSTQYSATFSGWLQTTGPFSTLTSNQQALRVTAAGGTYVYRDFTSSATYALTVLDVLNLNALNSNDNWISPLSNTSFTSSGLGLSLNSPFSFTGAGASSSLITIHYNIGQEQYQLTNGAFQSPTVPLSSFVNIQPVLSASMSPTCVLAGQVTGPSCVSLLPSSVTVVAVGTSPSISFTDTCQLSYLNSSALMSLSNISYAPVCRFAPSMVISPGVMVINTTSTNITFAVISCLVPSLLHVGKYVVQLSMDGGASFPQVPLYSPTTSSSIIVSTSAPASPVTLSVTTLLNHTWNSSLDPFPSGYNLGDVHLLTWSTPSTQCDGVMTPMYVNLLLRSTFLTFPYMSAGTLSPIGDQPLLLISPNLPCTGGNVTWTVPDLTTTLEEFGLEPAELLSLSIHVVILPHALNLTTSSAQHRRLLYFFTPGQNFALQGVGLAVAAIGLAALSPLLAVPAGVAAAATVVGFGLSALGFVDSGLDYYEEVLKEEGDSEPQGITPDDTCYDDGSCVDPSPNPNSGDGDPFNNSDDPYKGPDDTDNGDGSDLIDCTDCTGESNGDVHLTTYDGLHYDFQGVGAYWLTRDVHPFYAARNTTGFGVQLYLQPALYEIDPNSTAARSYSGVTLSTAVAISAGGSCGVVSLRARPSLSTITNSWIDVYDRGVLVLIPFITFSLQQPASFAQQYEVPCGTISMLSPSTAVIRTYQGFTTTASAYMGMPRFSNVVVSIPRRARYWMEGLLGSPDGNSTNDLTDFSGINWWSVYPTVDSAAFVFGKTYAVAAADSYIIAQVDPPNLLCSSSNQGGTFIEWCLIATTSAVNAGSTTNISQVLETVSASGVSTSTPPAIWPNVTLQHQAQTVCTTVGPANSSLYSDCMLDVFSLNSSSAVIAQQVSATRLSLMSIRIFPLPSTITPSSISVAFNMTGVWTAAGGTPCDTLLLSQSTSSISVGQTSNVCLVLLQLQGGGVFNLASYLPFITLATTASNASLSLVLNNLTASSVYSFSVQLLVFPSGGSPPVTSSLFSQSITTSGCLPSCVLDVLQPCGSDGCGGSCGVCPSSSSCSLVGLTLNASTNALINRTDGGPFACSMRTSSAHSSSSSSSVLVSMSSSVASAAASSSVVSVTSLSVLPTGSSASGEAPFTSSSTPSFSTSSSTVPAISQQVSSVLTPSSSAVSTTSSSSFTLGRASTGSASSSSSAPSAVVSSALSVAPSSSAPTGSSLTTSSSSGAYTSAALTSPSNAVSSSVASSSGVGLSSSAPTPSFAVTSSPTASSVMSSSAAIAVTPPHSATTGTSVPSVSQPVTINGSAVAHQPWLWVGLGRIITLGLLFAWVAGVWVL